MKAKLSLSGRENSSGPIDHCRRLESPDQCSHSPASRVTRVCGRALLSAPTVMARPVEAKGAI
ncbi:hypothetical protein D3C73_665150 [compost metagenome]